MLPPAYNAIEEPDRPDIPPREIAGFNGSRIKQFVRMKVVVTRLNTSALYHATREAAASLDLLLLGTA